MLDRVQEKRELRLQYHLEILADDDEAWPKLSWRGQLPASRAETNDKVSRRDLLAVDFNKACDREQILQPVEVDLVLTEERHERPHSEPCGKKRKRSKKSSKSSKSKSSKKSEPSSEAPTARSIGFVWDVESSEDEVDDLQMCLDDNERDFL